MEDDKSNCEELKQMQFEEIESINLEQESFCLEWQMFLDNL
jgi:hypothetical protein